MGEGDGGGGADDERIGGARRGGRDWALEHREVVHDGLYRIDRVRFRHALHGGGTSGTLERELFLRGDIVGVLIRDPAADRVLLVEQFRIGAMHRSPDPWLREIVAGGIAAGESPEQAARREAKEETGLDVDRLERVARYLASPGMTTEEVHVFVADCDLSNVVEGRHGLVEEDEDILVQVVPVERAIAMLDTGEVCNALSIVALQWLRHERLRERRPR